MASPIKNVVLVGAGGNLGPAVLKEFLASSLNVTVLSRPDSKSTFPAEVKVVKSDYTPDSLKAAFANQDAVVSLVGTPAFGAQQTLIDAAAAAGVKRFVPSEYGCDTSNPAVIATVPFLGAKRQVAEYLQSKESAGLTWSALITGPFFDWGLKVGFLGFDVQGRKVTKLWDGGETPVALTTLSTIGKALVGLLSRKDAYEKSRNTYVHVASHTTTQLEIKAAFEKVTGSKWEVVQEVDAEKRAQEVGALLAKGDFSAATDLLLVASFGKKEKLGVFPKLWNEELGLPKESLEENVKAVVDGSKP